MATRKQTAAERMIGCVFGNDSAGMCEALLSHSEAQTDKNISNHSSA